MAAITFIQSSDDAFSKQLTQFANSIDEFALTLGLTVAEVNSAKADAKYYAYVVQTAALIKVFQKTTISFKKHSRNGSKKDFLLNFPPTPIFDTPPPAVKPNIQPRFSKLVKKIKSSKNYNSAIGKALSIEAIHSHFDIQAGQPKVSVIFTGGHQRIKYKRGKYEGAEIWKDEGNGYFLLKTVTKSIYVDKTELPPAGTSAIWKYKLVYLYKDVQVGKWSSEIITTVTRI